MKRSLIAWDQTELPRAVLDSRLEKARSAAAALGVSALVVYTDVWRSNPARSLVNFMPFWGRSLLVVPRDGGPILLCGHSPRVYPWLRTVTYVEDLRPGKDLAAELLALASEHAWKRIGVADLPKLPYGIYRPLADADVELADVASETILGASDATELSMRRTAAAATRRLVEQAVSDAAGRPEHALEARLERALRLGGMEDLVIKITEGTSVPRPASARPVGSSTSVVVASEYRGHWVQVSRPVGAADGEARAAFLDSLNDATGARLHRFDLAGAWPFQSLSPDASIEPGRLVALHLEHSGGRFYGDTCLSETPSAAKLL